MVTAAFDMVACSRSFLRRLLLALAGALIVSAGLGGSVALAAGEAHSPLLSFGSFADPNGVAVEESTGDVYVADVGTDTVSRFDAEGNPVAFSALHSNTLSGGGTPAGSFSFPDVYGTPAQVAVDNSADPSDPSRGDLYVMDAGHEAIDKFNAEGEYLGQIAGPFEEGLLGFALETNGDLRVEARTSPGHGTPMDAIVMLFDNAVTNNFLARVKAAARIDGDGDSAPEDGLADGPTGDSYMLFEGCGCVEKFGVGDSLITGLGRLDEGPGDVAMAVDPVSGHLYVDGQSAVAEWDTGGMDGYEPEPGGLSSDVGSGEPVSSFGSGELEPSALGVPQGGIAVNGANGEVYVANPGDGRVYAYATAPPAVTAGTAIGVTKTSATLRGSVDPRGVAVTSCVFEYEKAPIGVKHELSIPVTVFTHSVSCAQTAPQIGSGMSSVPVSAAIGGLEPGQLYYFRLVAGNASGTSPSQGMVATASSGFGIQNFGVSFLNANGTPDTQAGSHPYQLVTSFIFNTQATREVTTVDSPYQIVPVQSFKDTILDPPPGVVGYPNATAAKCTVEELEVPSSGTNAGVAACPAESQIGTLYIETRGYGTGTYALYNMVPPRGVAAQFGAHVIFPDVFINIGLQTGEQYPTEAESHYVPALEPVYKVRTTLFGAVNSGENRRPFVTLPTGCTGPLKSTIAFDSYENPGHWVQASEITRNVNGEPLPLTGCSLLKFPPALKVAPDLNNASSSSGLTLDLHMPQAAVVNNPEGLAESSVRDTTVALPAGVSINPAGGSGLEACSESLAGFMGLTEFNPQPEPGAKWATFTPAPLATLQPGVSFCPNASKIGTVKIKTPSLAEPLEGAMYVATQNENPFGSLVAMYMMIEDPVSGITVKLAGEVRLCETAGQVLDGVSCQAPGQVIATFENTPDLPFEDFELHFFGGERAPLNTPTHCGTYTTHAWFTPWDGNSPVETASSFAIEHGPNGGPCPGTSLPFEPTLTTGSTSNQAGGFSPFTMTMSREDGQQSLQSVTLKMPPGLTGLLPGVELCPEPQADEGTCGPNSLIGETTVSVGVGNDPFTVKGGKVYLTGPYRGAPFGLSIVNPAKAGPYDVEHDTANPNYDPACDCIVVRAKIEVDQLTGVLTVTTDDEGPYKVPTILDGIPLEIKHVNVTINRPHFTTNPTNCSPLGITGTIYSNEGATSAVSVPFQATNCAALAFKPKLEAFTSGRTSRAAGASLSARLSYPAGPYDANLAKVKVELPKALPSRLTTLQKACTAAVFEANPAACPPASIVGHATAITPLLPVPVTGPAYFVSHGGEAFPSLIMVLQGYGVTVHLVGTTFIDEKTGITSSTFKAVPDVPVGSFELTLPQGPYSALTANTNLCKAKNLAIPTEFIGQNGAEIHTSTKIAVSGCPKALHKAKKKKARHRHRKAARHGKRR